jgi:hypothetical protein
VQLPEALRDALGQIIANERREWRRERELIEAQARTVIAELRAENVALVARIEDMVTARLATLRDGKDGIDGKDGRDGVDGKSVTLEDVTPTITEAVSRAVAELPPPKDGADGKDGVDGRCVTAEDLAPLVAAEVERVVATIAPPKDGTPGKDADPAEIARMVESAVAALPRPKDGRDGKDADPAEVARMVSEAVAALPRPTDGKDADPEVVRAMVADAVAAIPAPERGEPGPPGKLPLVRAWRDTVHYEGDVVTYAGSVYQAQRDTGREPPHEDWLCIARSGRDGADGRSLNIRGTWSDTETYRYLDVVAFNGGSFVARKDDPGPCPGDGWQLHASPGKRGQPGEPGRRGEPGPPGAPLIEAAVDEEGLVTLTNADRSSISLDLYPLLNRIAR